MFFREVTAPSSHLGMARNRKPMARRMCLDVNVGRFWGKKLENHTAKFTVGLAMLL